MTTWDQFLQLLVKIKILEDDPKHGLEQTTFSANGEGVISSNPTLPSVSISKELPAVEIVGGEVPNLHLSFAAATHVGRCRDGNEDNFYPGTTEKACYGLFIVADGMGGERGGAQASEEAIRVLAEQLRGWKNIDEPSLLNVESRMATAFQAATIAVQRLGEKNIEWQDAGTTAIVALIDGDTVHVGSLGDSHAYLMSSGRMRLLNEDHSIAALMAQRGEITSDEIRRHPSRNKLTRYIGMYEDKPSFYTQCPFQHGDRLLLCSDGLWDMVTDDEISLLSQTDDLSSAVSNLVHSANEAGGKDNITILLIEKMADSA